MNLTRIALARPVTVAMVFVCLGMIGAMSSRLLPLEFLPDIEIPGVWIELPYRNSTPEEVERRIIGPVEDQLATLSGVERMYSESRDDGGAVGVWFGWGADMRIKGVEVRDKLDAIRDTLPQDLQQIQVFKQSASDAPLMVLRVSANRDLVDAYEMLDRNLARRIGRLDGVSQVELYGVWAKQIRIELSADRVAATGADLRDVAERLRRANFELAAGEITDRASRFSVKPNARFNSVDDVRNMVVSDNGLRLRDIAEVKYTDPVRTRGRHLDGNYAVGLNVMKENGANMVEVADRVMDEIAVISELPEMQGITLFAMDNQADGVKRSLNDLLEAGLLGALLSLVVLYLFLRDWPMTLIVAMSVPCSILITLGAMYFLGYSLNILSMMGLMLSVGMLVDNAVVVVESIFTERQRESDPTEATVKGVDAVGLAVMAGTLTTAIVFLPNIFGEQNNISVFMAQVAIAICISLGASLAIARTLIPQLTSRIRANPQQKGSRVIGWLTARYPGLLRFTLRYRLAALIIIPAMLVLTVLIPIQGMEKDMFPANESERIMLPYHINNVYALATVEEAVDTIEAYLFEHQDEFEIESLYSYFDLGRAESTLILRPPEQRTKTPEQIKDAIMENLPKIAIGNPTFNQQRSAGPLSLFVTGKSTERLLDVANEVARLAEALPGLRSARVQSDAQNFEVRVKVDRDRARLLGLSSQQVAENVATAVRGVELRPYRGPNREVDMTLQFRSDDRLNIDQLRLLPVPIPPESGGGQVPLGSIAELSIGDVPATIRRQDRETALEIQLFTREDATADEVREGLQGLMETVQLPTGYAWKFGRAFDEEDESMQSMVINLLLAIALIYIVMAALFESLLAPFSIIWCIVFAFLGVFWAFWATGTNFEFMAMIGLLILMGIVVNNGIVMLDHVRNLRVSGMPRDEAIVRGATDRLRPILMTVATTVFGMIPLTMGDASIGGGGPAYAPMAKAIIAGLTVSTVISLVFLPTLYAMTDDLGNWTTRLVRRARGVDTSDPATAGIDLYSTS